MKEKQSVEISMRTLEAPEIRQTNKERRKITFVASDGTRDSAHTVLNPSGWDLERFNKNGIIGYQHKVYSAWDDTANPDNVIGKGHAYTLGGKLMVEIEFEPEAINPLAEKVYQKILFGSLKGVSVGFAPVGAGHWGYGSEAKGEANETYYYAGQELLEVSVVNIPANPNALKRGLEAEIKRIHGSSADARTEDKRKAPATKQKGNAGQELELETAKAKGVLAMTAGPRRDIRKDMELELERAKAVSALAKSASRKNNSKS